MEKTKALTQEQIMYNHIHQWKESGLTKQDYCLKNGITKDCLSYWCKKFRKQGCTPVKFVPVQISTTGKIEKDLLE